MATSAQHKEGSREDRLWEAAFAQLTSEGVVVPEQVEMLRQRHQQIELQQRERSRRTAVIELVGYLGAALTLGGVAAVSSQVWGDFSEFLQVLLTGALAVVVLLAAGLLAGLTPGGVSRLQTAPQASRRRLVGVLGVAGAGLTTATLALAIDTSASTASLSDWVWTAPLVGLLIASGVGAVAPGVVPTLGVGGFLAASVMTAMDALGWMDTEWTAPLAIMLVAAVASLVLVRWLKPVVLVEAISIFAWLGAATPMLSAEPGWGLSSGEASMMLWCGRIGVLALVAIGAWKFTHGGDWPWAIAVAAGSAAFVGFTFADALGGAIAMSVAGIVLIVVAFLMLRTRRTKDAAVDAA